MPLSPATKSAREKAKRAAYWKTPEGIAAKEAKEAKKAANKAKRQQTRVEYQRGRRLLQKYDMFTPLASSKKTPAAATTGRSKPPMMTPRQRELLASNRKQRQEAVQSAIKQAEYLESERKKQADEHRALMKEEFARQSAAEEKEMQNEEEERKSRLAAQTERAAAREERRRQLDQHHSDNKAQFDVSASHMKEVVGKQVFEMLDGEAELIREGLAPDGTFIGQLETVADDEEEEDSSPVTTTNNNRGPLGLLFGFIGSSNTSPLAKPSGNDDPRHNDDNKGEEELQFYDAQEKLDGDEGISNPGTDPQEDAEDVTPMRILEDDLVPDRADEEAADVVDDNTGAVDGVEHAEIVPTGVPEEAAGIIVDGNNTGAVDVVEPDVAEAAEAETDPNKQALSPAQLVFGDNVVSDSEEVSDWYTLGREELLERLTRESIRCMDHDDLLNAHYACYEHDKQCRDKTKKIFHMRGMSLDCLRVFCKRLGLPREGNKSQVVAMIVARGEEVDSIVTGFYKS